MPRTRRKPKPENKRYEAANNSASDDESINDNNSEWSTQSDAKSVQEIGDENVEENVKSPEDTFEETLSMAAEGLGQKSLAARVKCWNAACGALKSRPASHIISNYRLTLNDHIEKALKRSKPEEQAAAAELASLMAIQFGATDLCEDLCKDVKPILQVVALDKSANANARAKCCTALALLSFFAEEDIGNIYETMRNFETIFSGSYLKGDGTIKNNITSEQENLHSVALSAWALLLTLCSPGDIYMMLGGSTHTFAPSLRQLGGMLASPGLEIRLGAGECLALVFELGREHSGDFGDTIVEELIDKIKQLATDSHKYRAKKDRKTQRATFRDILHYLEEDEVDELPLRLHSEHVQIEGWCARRRYSALAGTLGSGLHTHLASSAALRAALALPPPALLIDPQSVSARNNNKLLRHLQNAAAFKARTITRGKNRDKRSAVIMA